LRCAGNCTATQLTAVQNPRGQQLKALGGSVRDGHLGLDGLDGLDRLSDRLRNDNGLCFATWISGSGLALGDGGLAARAAAAASALVDGDIEVGEHLGPAFAASWSEGLDDRKIELGSAHRV
jgi:hypothetical protein